MERGAGGTWCNGHLSNIGWYYTKEYVILKSGKITIIEKDKFFAIQNCQILIVFFVVM